MSFVTSSQKTGLKNISINIMLFLLVAGVGFYSVRIYEYLTEPPIFIQSDNSKFYGKITNDTILLYSTSWCSICEKTRSYLKKNNFKYIERDIEKNAIWAGHIAQLNTNVVPLLIIGEYIIYGFRPTLIKKFVTSSRTQFLNLSGQSVNIESQEKNYNDNNDKRENK